MAKVSRRIRPEALAELQSWYLARLGPKLAVAAQAGKVEAVAAVAVDRELRGLFELADGPHEEAA